MADNRALRVIMLIVAVAVIVGLLFSSVRFAF
jgi:hypothetical protein